MKRLLIGLGNPLAGDDGFGPRVLARLSAEGGLPEDVERIDSTTDLLGLVDRLHRYAAIVLVDALMGGGGAPGRVSVLEESALLAWDARSSSAHRLCPVEALRVFRALAPHAPTRVVLVALHTDGIGEQPAHATESAVKEGARLARAELTKKEHPGGCPLVEPESASRQ